MPSNRIFLCLYICENFLPCRENQKTEVSHNNANISKNNGQFISTMQMELEHLEFQCEEIG